MVVKDFRGALARPRKTVSRPIVLTLDINVLTAPASQACCKPNDIGAVILSARHPRAEARGVGRRLLRKLLPSTVGVMRERGRGVVKT